MTLFTWSSFFARLPPPISRGIFLLLLGWFNRADSANPTGCWHAWREINDILKSQIPMREKEETVADRTVVLHVCRQARKVYAASVGVAVVVTALCLLLPS